MLTWQPTVARTPPGPRETSAKRSLVDAGVRQDVLPGLQVFSRGARRSRWRADTASKRGDAAVRSVRPVDRLDEHRERDLAMRDPDARSARREERRRFEVHPGGVDHLQRQLALGVGVGEVGDPVAA
jgi:hypothetical protein